MRERGPFIREARPWAAIPARGLPVVGLYLLGGALMAHVGAFHTDEVSPLVRYPYFLTLNLAAGLVAVAIGAAVMRRPGLARRPLARMGAEALGVTVLLTPLVWIMAAWLLGGDPDPSRMIDLSKQVAPVAALFAPLHLLTTRSSLPVATTPTPTVASPQAEPIASRRPGLYDWLPLKLRDSDLWAIEAHDHYLRVHTSRGSALLAMRMADALQALSSENGARTHRSWWVARSAVLGAKRGRGRATLQLPGGLSAPVSRTYSPQLRDAGWFRSCPRRTEPTGGPAD